MITATLIAKIFFFGFIIDFIWVFYILSITRKKNISASIASAVMAAPGIFGYFEMYDERLLTIPYLLGLAFGTYFGVKLQEWMKEED